MYLQIGSICILLGWPIDSSGLININISKMNFKAKLLFATTQIIFFYYFIIYSHVYTLFGPPHPLPPAAGRTCNTFLFSDFVEEKNIKDNKKDISFLLVEIKIAIQRDS
jgi:hypothetical protein